MKNLVLFCSLTFCGAVQSDVRAQEPVAIYRLDGNAIDSSSNRLDGLLFGAKSVVSRFGGASLKFNGSSDYIDLGNPAEFNFESNFTLTAWIKPSGTPLSTYVLAKYADYGNNVRAPLSYGLGISLDFRPYAFVSESASTYSDIVGTGPQLSDENWYALAMTYDRDFGIRLYADGELVGEKQVSGLGPFSNIVPLTIGKAFSGQHFEGVIDDINVFDRALSSVEIRNLFLVESADLILITHPPQNAWIEVGTNATFFVEISGINAGTAHYQWFEDGEAVVGATNETFTTTIQETVGQKVYTVVVSTDEQSIKSTPAILTVSPVGQLGLIAYWSFDEEFAIEVTDSAGSFPGANRNGVRVPGRDGGGALFLNGSDAFVYVGGQNSGLELTATPYTFSWWQRWNGANGLHQVVIAMDDGQDYSAGYQTYIPRNTTRFAVVHSNGENPAWSTVDTNTEWHHYAVTHDGEELRFYADGLLAASEPRLNRVLQDGDDPFVIGGLALPTGQVVNLFNGILDEIRVYARALAPEEIAQLGPEPSIIFVRNPLGYNVGEAESVRLSVEAATLAIPSPITYQWFENDSAIAGATNNYLNVSGTGGLRNFKVLATAGQYELFSDSATVRTITPSQAKLLLHLDFEDSNYPLIDSASGSTNIFGNITRIQGRTGHFAASLDSLNYIRVPAKGTDLELVGTSYTITWWMRPSRQSGSQQIFNVGSSEGDVSGFGARLEGAINNRFVRFEHRPISTNQLFMASMRNVEAEWVHLALVYNGVQRTLFSNAVSVASIVTTADVVGSGRHDLFIGGQFTNLTSNLGAIDDFRIYNYPLTSDEIAALANPPAAPISVFISHSNATVSIQWPISTETEYRVEYSEQINSTNSWTPLTAPTGTAEGYRYTIQPASEGIRFYRLRKL